MDLRGQRVAAEFTWVGGKFVRDVVVDTSTDGVIRHVGARDASPAISLTRTALIPGFVNAHSHAFQRGLRCEAQRFISGAGNFWSWRETMYRLVDVLDVDSFYTYSRQAFEEMLAAGITAVGEFHYLHHAGTNGWVFDDAILSAAKDAGIRLCLIQTYYATGNVAEPLAGAQLRFNPVSRDAFLAQLARLERSLDRQTQSIALACHSIRAVGLDDLRYFRALAAERDWPFHIHVEEVRKEIADCRAAYGAGPMATLLKEVAIDPDVTAIHCTHSARQDLKEWTSRGANICLCPLTEGNLSDGFADLPAIVEMDGRICFGTDSNIRISAAEELRMMEFGHRARHERRGVMVNSQGSCAAAMMRAGTANGAAALKLNCGEIKAGAAADLVAIDLEHPTMLGCAPDAIADSFVFGSGNEAISGVWVGGRSKV